MTPLDYILSRLRRAADNAYPWSLTPTEAGALVAEAERLRKECGQAYLQGVKAGREAERIAERAAVVAWLRSEATDGFVTLRINHACAAEKFADAIERGEHRREGEP